MLPSFIIFLTSLLDIMDPLCYASLTGSGHGRTNAGTFQRGAFLWIKTKYWENAGQDEMEKTIRIEGESFSLTLTLMMGLVLVIFNHLHGLSSDPVLIMFWTSCISRQLYKLTRRREKWDLISLIISLVILVFYVVKYFSQGW